MIRPLLLGKAKSEPEKKASQGVKSTPAKQPKVSNGHSSAMEVDPTPKKAKTQSQSAPLSTPQSLSANQPVTSAAKSKLGTPASQTLDVDMDADDVGDTSIMTNTSTNDGTPAAGEKKKKGKKRKAVD